jgi:hypothetical protein
MRFWLRAVCVLAAALPLRAAADPPRPWLDHLVPLGAQQGQTITLDMYGQYLSNVESVWPFLIFNALRAICGTAI